jgi:D-alanine-D-alanine ligase
MRTLGVATPPAGRAAGGEVAAPAPVGGQELALTEAAGAMGQLDVVFPVLHGPHGEDGTLQGLLELAGLPYVGAGVLGSAVSMDKAVMKMVFQQAGLPVAPYRLLRRSELGDQHLLHQRIEGLRYPFFVKPCNLGSSVGITRVADPGELAAALQAAAAYDRRILVEQGVPARELECGVLGNDHPEASVVGEILSSHVFYDFEAKYDGSSGLKIPAQVPAAISERVRELAVQAFMAVDAAGMARVDFFYDEGAGEVYVNEINTIPGFTAFSMFPLLWQATGVSARELCSRLVDLALQRHAERNPGAGGESGA